MTEEARSRSWWTRMFRGGDESTPGGEAEDGAEPPTPEEECVRLRALLAEVSTAADEAEQRAERDRTHAASLEREHDRLLEERDRLQRRLAGSDEALGQLREQVDRSKQALRSTEATLRQTAAELVETKRRQDESQKGNADRDKRILAMTSELSKLRAAKRKAEEAQRAAGLMAGPELAKTKAALTKANEQLEQLQTALDEERRLHSEAEELLRAETTRRKLAETKRREMDGELRGRSLELERVRRELAEAVAARAQAESDAAPLQQAVADGERAQEALRAELAAARTFARTAILVAADSLRQCVGDRRDLPLALAWRRPSFAQGLAVPPDLDDAGLAHELTRHLDDLGLCDVVACRTEPSLELRCAVSVADDERLREETDFAGLVAWMQAYLRAWLQAARGRIYRLTTVETSAAEGTFSLTFE